VFERESLRGIIPPLATPLTPAGEVDAGGMRRLVDHVLGAGVHGIFVLGSTGEFPFLTARQRVDVVAAAVEAVNGRVPVVAGISAVGTREAIEHGRAARKAGADFLIVTAPYFGRMAMPQEWIAQHVQSIADEAGAPLLLYNVPPLINDMEPPTIARLAEHPGIVGMKDSGSLIHVQDVIFRTRARSFRVLAGLEYHLVAAMLVGAHGGTPSPSNIIPRWYVEMYDLAVAGRVADALAAQERANRFVDRLDEIPCWPTAVKGALSLMGICGPTVAAPQPALTTEERDLLRDHLRVNGLLA